LSFGLGAKAACQEHLTLLRRIPDVSGPIWRRGLFAAAAAISGFAALIAVRSYIREVREFFPERRPVEVPIESAGLAGLRSVAFRDRRGALIHGWYAPSANRAGVILVHGAGGDRASLLPEARHLASRGFGVLVFDWPGHGESEGEIHWNEGEAEALSAAVDFLGQQSDLDSTRLGALGFSLGGAVLARVAPTEQRLRGVVFVGTPSDQLKQIAWENRQWGPLSQLPSRWAVQRGGMRIYDMQPRDRVAAIAPRPVLIVNGTHDDVVPAFLAHDLFAAAHEPKALLLVEGAGHGRFEHVPGSTYLDRIAAFFEAALLGETRT
jgi:alpha-beta hydrolase superfamily lysophospholipase